MVNTLTLAILRDLIPEGIEYGTNLLVEFSPDTLWYETSITITADALKRGIATEYHSFQHLPEDIRRGFTQLGVDVKKLEADDVLRIIDDYTPQIGLRESGRSMKIADWSISIAQRMRSPGKGKKESVLHVDDNIAILARYNSESAVIDWFRTRAIPLTRTIGRVAIDGLLTGVASDGFYRQVESLCDGIVDFKTEEKEGQTEQYVRVRIIRGRRPDSRWHKIAASENFAVALEK